MLNGRKVLLGITGSIAAYKCVQLVRLFKKAGAEVKIIMTESASDFVTKTSLSTVSGNPVYDRFTKNTHGEWVNHVDMGMWADVFIIAPASANTLFRCANGACDNLLTAVYLSARCPVFFAPAMDVDMFRHPTTAANIGKLKQFGNKILWPETGELASGLTGEGRLMEPEKIFETINSYLSGPRGKDGKDSYLSGKHILISAGPTHESIDPVRFIGNHSSGKMGYAIAEAFAYQGAYVTLISGPVDLQINHPNVQVISISNAEEMLRECNKHFGHADITVMSAAVSDYTPLLQNKSKMKKGVEKLTIELKPTEDILAGLGKKKKSHQYLVGFALETRDLEKYAKEKIKRKNLDMIVANVFNKHNPVFGSDLNEVYCFFKDGRFVHKSRAPKSEIAESIVNLISEDIIQKQIQA
jgi:phosphopantothenoylcysteine decarboxylase/phosphopantothenate--cysteine ligase